MGLNPTKRAFLTEAWGEDVVSGLEESLKNIASVPQGAGVDYKEQGKPVPTDSSDAEGLAVEPDEETKQTSEEVPAESAQKSEAAAEEEPEPSEPSPKIIVIEDESGNKTVAVLDESAPKPEPDEKTLTQRLDAIEEMVSKLATNQKDIGDSTVQIMERLPDVVADVARKSIAEWLANLPRADVYRISKDTANVVATAKDAVGNMSDAARDVSLDERWEQHQGDTMRRGGPSMGTPMRART